MARTEYTADQIRDSDHVEEIELISDGNLNMTGPFSIVSINGPAKTIVVSGGNFLDKRVALGDRVEITGTASNNGIFTVNSVTDDNTAVVAESMITEGAGGTCEILFPPGAELTGAEDPGVAYTHGGTYQTVQDHINDSTAHSAAGGGITAPQHRALDQLVHEIAEDSFDEIIRVSGKVTNVITWTDNLKTIKIRESIFTYTGNNATTVVTKQYDSPGTSVVETITETITYTGNQANDIARVLT